MRVNIPRWRIFWNLIHCKVCFFREKEKKYLFLHIKTTHLSLSASSSHIIIEERLYLSFTKKLKKKKIQRSLLMLDARVKLRQKAQLAELCSRWVGTNILFTFSFVFFFARCVFPFACGKSQRVLDIHFLCWDARALCAFVMRCNKILTTLLLHTHTLSPSLKQTCDRSWKS